MITLKHDGEGGLERERNAFSGNFTYNKPSHLLSVCQDSLYLWETAAWRRTARGSVRVRQVLNFRKTFIHIKKDCGL